VPCNFQTVADALRGLWIDRKRLPSSALADYAYRSPGSGEDCPFDRGGDAWATTTTGARAPSPEGQIQAVMTARNLDCLSLFLPTAFTPSVLRRSERSVGSSARRYHTGYCPYTCRRLRRPVSGSHFARSRPLTQRAYRSALTPAGITGQRCFGALQALALRSRTRLRCLSQSKLSITIRCDGITVLTVSRMAAAIAHDARLLLSLHVAVDARHP
jgi:hypothetical protein